MPATFRSWLPQVVADQTLYENVSPDALRHDPSTPTFPVITLFDQDATFDGAPVSKRGVS